MKRMLTDQPTPPLILVARAPSPLKLSHPPGGEAMKAAVVLGIFVVLLSVPPAVSQVADELLIVPGQRIGRVRLEHSIDDVI